MVVPLKVQPRNVGAVSSRRVSIADLFTIGIGPSSSHTVGPMRAAKRFLEELSLSGLQRPTRIKVELFGSLSLTGKGHRADVAIVLGLLGWTPENVDPDRVDEFVDEVRRRGQISLHSKRGIAFAYETDLLFSREFHPAHPNALTFTVFADQAPILSRTYFSVGGGFVVSESELSVSDSDNEGSAEVLPFSSARELLEIGRTTGLSFAEIILTNEMSLRSRPETLAFVDKVRAAMMACIERGYRRGGELPGLLRVKRRAKQIHDRLMQRGPASDPLNALDWVSLFALSVNEENAAGGRSRNGADERRRRCHSGSPQILRDLLQGSNPGRLTSNAAYRCGYRDLVQKERFHIGSRNGLPG